jgi:hypothetical protein
MSTKDVDFTGGDVVFYNADSDLANPRSQKDIRDAEMGILHFEKEEQRVEPRAGRVAIFSSGHENPHKVERVTSGYRYVLAFWFTCDEKRAFQIFLDGSAHTAFSEEFAADLHKRAGGSSRRQQTRPANPGEKTGNTATEAAAADSQHVDAKDDKKKKKKTKKRRTVTSKGDL